MAIALTTQPTNNGYYSGYLQVNFVATETTNNPAYLTFEIKTSAGVSIPNVPPYKAPNINNEYFFDASNYLKSIFDVRSMQGLDSSAITELTDLYGKFEVVVSDTINALSPLTSNEFYAFSFLDNRVNDTNEEQSARYPIDYKNLLYASDLNITNPKNFCKKIQGIVDGVSLFVTKESLIVDTYQVSEPNNGSTIFETGVLDLTTYLNKLIRVPLNKDFIISEFVKSGGGTLATFESFRVRESGTNTNCTYYHVNNLCNTIEFVFKNRYGCLENIIFQTYLNEKASTKSDEFMSGYVPELTFPNFFNTSANTLKINQEFSQEFEVRSQYFSQAHKEELRDFINSQWHICIIINNNESNICFVNLFDGVYTLVDGSRGIKFNFKYKNSQKPLAFI